MTARESPCRVNQRRAGMSDEEFWADVAASLSGEPLDGVDNDPEDDLGEPRPDWRCDVCGEVGGCGYDSEGRVLVHVDYALRTDA